MSLNFWHSSGLNVMITVESPFTVESPLNPSFLAFQLFAAPLSSLSVWWLCCLFAGWACSFIYLCLFSSYSITIHVCTLLICYQLGLRWNSPNLVLSLYFSIWLQTVIISFPFLFTFYPRHNSYLILHVCSTRFNTSCVVLLFSISGQNWDDTLPTQIRSLLTYVIGFRCHTALVAFLWWYLPISYHLCLSGFDQLRLRWNSLNPVLSLFPTILFTCVYRYFMQSYWVQYMGLSTILFILVRL